MNSTHLPPDPEGLALAEACHAGDRKAQHVLWERFKNKMFGVCLRFSSSRPEAEDVLQEAFLQVFEHIGRYRGEGSLEGWVRRVVVRTCIHQLKKRQTTTVFQDETQLEQLLEQLDQRQCATEPDEPGQLVALLQQLPDGFRAVLNMYALEDRSHEEIARELHISIGTSKSQLHRAKAFMRKLLEQNLSMLL